MKKQLPDYIVNLLSGRKAGVSLGQCEKYREIFKGSGHELPELMKTPKSTTPRSAYRQLSRRRCQYLGGVAGVVKCQSCANRNVNIHHCNLLKTDRDTAKRCIPSGHDRVPEEEKNSCVDCTQCPHFSSRRKSESGYKKPVSLKPVNWNPKRHLIFHIYPVASKEPLWKWHLDWIKKHADLFNGRKIVGISVDSKTVSAEQVIQYLGDSFECRVSGNVPKEEDDCCENVTFFDGLESLDDGICFYAHAKGVSSRKVTDEVARKWSSAMYSHLLDEFSPGMLLHNGAYGTFLTDYRKTAVLSGTFFWFRVPEAKERNWRTGHQYHAVELWPTKIFQDKMECFAKYDMRGNSSISMLQKKETWNRLEKEWGDQDSYRERFLKALEESKRSEFPSDRYRGRGIVMPAGGWWKLRKPHQPYIWCAYTATSAIRRKGCSLPVQWWFLPGEIEEIGAEKVHKWAGRVGATIRVADKSVKGGWQIKIHAILNAGFKEVIHLDSDVISAIDPERLFDEPGYKKTGVQFWADNPNLTGKFEKCSYVLPAMWDRMGLPRRSKVRDIEAGQMVIDLECAWKALQVDQHFSENAEYWEGFNGGAGGVWYGDKTSHHVACLVTETPYDREDRFHFKHREGWYGHCLSTGEIVLQHCCHRKGELVEGREIPGMKEAPAIASFGRLRKSQEKFGNHIGDYRFLHIFKTGGTSVRGALIEAGMPKWRAEHYRYADRPDQELNLKTITVLRHPVDRIISHYNDMLYRWKNSENWVHDISIEDFRKMSLVEFAEYDNYGVSANQMTRQFGPSLGDAIRNVQECEVWHTQTLAKNVKSLSQRIKREIRIGHVNARPPGSHGRKGFIASELAKVEELAKDDMTLWRYSHSLK